MGKWRSGSRGLDADIAIRTSAVSLCAPLLRLLDEHPERILIPRPILASDRIVCINDLDRPPKNLLVSLRTVVEAVLLADDEVGQFVAFLRDDARVVFYSESFLRGDYGECHRRNFVARSAPDFQMEDGA